MKIILIITIFLMNICNVVFADELPIPINKVVIFYRVDDTVLQAQNANGDMVKGMIELEEEIKDCYSNRFIIAAIKRDNINSDFPYDYQPTIKANQKPLVINYKLTGEGVKKYIFHNAYGTIYTGYAPSVDVACSEMLPSSDGMKFHKYDYGEYVYSAGVSTYKTDIWAKETDPRKNAKNAIKSVMRKVCSFKRINKYTNPNDYKLETNRYLGNFIKIYEK